jgi:hypothetical protein
MVEQPEPRLRAITRQQQLQNEVELRLVYQRQAGIMWAQGLFESNAQACAHFGLASTFKPQVRYHYNTFKHGKHSDSEREAFNSFSKSSLPKCTCGACPCQGPVHERVDDDAHTDAEMTQDHWKTLLYLMKNKEKSSQQIADEFYAETGVKRSRPAIAKYRRQRTKTMPTMGRPTYLPSEAEQKVVDSIKFLRSNRIPVYSMHVAMIAEELARKVGLAPSPGFGRKWVDGFLKRHETQLGQHTQTIIEDLRAHYCTASKLRRHYQVVADFLVELGWAVRNPEYDPDIPFDSKRPNDPRAVLVFIDPKYAHRIVSMDETRFTLNQCKEGKGPARAGKKTLVVKSESFTGADKEWGTDTGEVIMNKSNYDCTIVGGSSADANALPALYIFAGSFSWHEDMKGAPKCAGRWDADGNLLSAFGWHNEKGSMTDDVMMKWLNTILLPCFPDLSKENPIVLICDGYGSHLAWDFIQACVKKGVHVILRPPHTSHVTQGEDVVGGHFHTFHRLERVAKVNLSQALLASSKKKSQRKLQRRHVMQITANAWQDAFSVSVCQHAWQHIGIYPQFDMRPYWEQKAKEVSQEKLKASVTPMSAEQRRQRREDLGAAAANIDPQELVVHLSSDSDSEGDGAVDGRRKRKNLSGQYALLSPITAGAALQLRTRLEAESAAQEQERQQRIQEKEAQKNAAHEALREAGSEIHDYLVREESRVSSLVKKDMIALLCFLGKSASDVGLTPTSKVPETKRAFLLHIASLSHLPYAARAQSALAAP